jgi:hypothetical protein
VRYDPWKSPTGDAGVLASAHQWRSLVVPPRPAEDDTDETEHAHAHDTADERPATHRCRYRPWAELMKRSFAIDVEHCSRCGGRLELRSLVMPPPASSGSCATSASRSSHPFSHPLATRRSSQLASYDGHPRRRARDIVRHRSSSLREFRRRNTAMSGGLRSFASVLPRR